jgi:PPOX class probable F420-dependent enzyme
MVTIPDSHRDLLVARVATVATVGADDRPQLTEVWFLHDEEGGFCLSLNTARQKTKNLLERPGISLLILDLVNPMRYLEVRGDAVVEDDPDYTFAARLGAKYSADLRLHDRPGERRVKVTIRPSRINAVNMGA